MTIVCNFVDNKHNETIVIIIVEKIKGNGQRSRLQMPIGLYYGDDQHYK